MRWGSRWAVARREDGYWDLPARTILLLMALYVVYQVFVSEWLEGRLVAFVDWLVAFVDWLVRLGGYGLSNIVFGVLVGAICLVLLDRVRSRQRGLEAKGDLDPPKPPFDYTTGSRGSLWLGWAAGLIGWGAGAAMLLHGSLALFVIGPVIGTAAILWGRQELAHAKVMDARRGAPPETAGRP